MSVIRRGIGRAMCINYNLCLSNHSLEFVIPGGGQRTQSR
ncbi:hypothetical protein M758_6G049900 [Ceratodon purpureus]|nr:hypothetical protein M758_6G049900 [Ceratodon purpureus]